MKTAIKYKLDTKEILGVVQVSTDTDLELNTMTGEGAIEIPHDHPCVGGATEEWKIILDKQEGKNVLLKKPEAVIQKQKADKEKKQLEDRLRAEQEIEEARLKPYKVLLGEINALRVKLDMPEKTLGEIVA